MKRILLAVLMAIAASTTYAQAVKVPQDYSFESQADFKKYKGDVLPILNWLESNPMQPEDPTYKAASSFISEWTTGSEDVDIKFDQRIIKFSESNPDLLLYFISGWTRYELAHPDKNDLVQNNLAGLNSVLKFYKSQEVSQNDELDALYAAQQKNGLEAWVKKRLQDPE